MHQWLNWSLPGHDFYCFRNRGNTPWKWTRYAWNEERRIGFQDNVNILVKVSAIQGANSGIRHLLKYLCDPMGASESCQTGCDHRIDSPNLFRNPHLVYASGQCIQRAHGTCTRCRQPLDLYREADPGGGWTTDWKLNHDKYVWPTTADVHDPDSAFILFMLIGVGIFLVYKS